MSENVTNTLLETNQQMIDASISNLRFDKTEVSTVTEVISDTEYQVYNGKTKYRATSLSDTKYSENQQVYVQIKEGDYSLEKTIIGKYDVTNSEELGQLYQDPFDRLLISQTINFELSKMDRSEMNWVTNTGNVGQEIEIYPTGLGTPNFLGTNISVSTNIDYRTYPKAEYGLKIRLIDKDGSYLDLVISSKDFVGNIFKFTPELIQKNLLRLPDNFDLNKVKKIRVVSYSMEDSTKENSNALDSNSITWKSIVLYFGYDNQSSEFSSSSDKVFIDTNTGLKAYNFKSLSEKFNIDLEKDSVDISLKNIKSIEIPPNSAEPKKDCKYQVHYEKDASDDKSREYYVPTGAYNDTKFYFDSNGKIKKGWQFYNYNKGPITKDDKIYKFTWNKNWCHDWQNSKKQGIADEDALEMNMPSPNGQVFKLFANSTFLAYPLELNWSEEDEITYEYRNCFGFFERNAKQYYGQNFQDDNSELDAGRTWTEHINLIDDEKGHKITASEVSGFYHFKINLETENERVDLRDRVIGPIDSKYVDFKITVSQSSVPEKALRPLLRIDNPRDLNNSANNITIKEFSITETNLVLRYYSKDETLNTTNFPSNYLTENIGMPTIVHIPYGALVWIGNIKTELNVSSSFSIENSQKTPLTARVRFNHFILNSAVYANEYYADKVGVYKIPIENYDTSTFEETTYVYQKEYSGTELENNDLVVQYGDRYFGKDPSVQKIGITNLYETPGAWGEYSQDFVVDYGYMYYIGISPQFSFKGLDTVSNPYIYIDDFKLYTLEPKELTTLYGSWVYDNNVYGQYNQPENNIVPYWYQKVPNYEGELDGIGPWWKKIIKTPAVETAAAIYETGWNLNVKPYLSDKADEVFKFVVKKEDKTFVSEDFVLTNKGYSVARDTIESEGFVFTNSDDGIYLYDYTGNLYNNEGTEKTLTITPKGGETEIQESNIIAWMIPKNSTMIQPPQYSQKDTSTSDGNTIKEYYWPHDPDTVYSEPPSLENFNDNLSTSRYDAKLLSSFYIMEQPCNLSTLTLNYKIKQVYQPNNMNNDILVYVFENDTVNHPKYKESKYTPRFISANNAGAQASLGIELISEKGYLGADNTEDIKLQATAYDSTGVRMATQPTMSWEIINGAPTALYHTVWNKENAGQQINSNTIEVSKDYEDTGNPYYQVVFKTNTTSGQGPVIPITDEPKIYSVKVGTDKVETATYKYCIEIKIDEFRDTNEDYLQYLLYMVPSGCVNEIRDNNDDGEKCPYFISTNSQLTIHYVYSCTAEEGSSRMNSSRIFQSYKFNNDTKQEDFIEFDSSYYDIDDTDTNRYILKDTVTEIYVRVNMPSEVSDDNTHYGYGARPYINFKKFEADTASKRKFYLNYLPEEGKLSSNNSILTINKEITNSLIVKAYCNYLLENNKTVQLSQYYTLPYFPTNQKYQLDGDTKISYSTFGTNPTSTGKEYSVYKNSSTGLEKIDNFYTVPTSFSGQISSLDKKTVNSGEIAWQHKINLPTIAPAEVDWGNLDIYIANEWNANGTPSQDNSQLVAQYPMVLYRDSYAFQEINNWNGTSTITDEAYIISPMIAAGKKDSNNQFTGVMLGIHSKFPSTGLYGFQNGAATFGFKEDGSCFIGANEETGRIEFNTGDNNNLKIVSKDFDLQAGITINESTVTGSGIKINNSGICGYKDGKLIFKFKDDGSCLFGQEGSDSRIELEDDNLIIKSKEFSLTSDYVSIDKSGITINGGNFTVKDNNEVSVLYFRPNTKELMLKGSLTDGRGGIVQMAGSALSLQLQEKNSQEMVQWIEIKPITNENYCTIAGKGGLRLIDTDVSETKTFATFSYGKTELKANNCTRLETTTTGGTLYDNWTITKLYIGNDTNTLFSSTDDGTFVLRTTKKDIVVGYKDYNNIRISSASASIAAPGEVRLSYIDGDSSRSMRLKTTSEGGQLFSAWSYGTLSGGRITASGLNISNDSYSVYKTTEDRTAVKGLAGAILVAGSTTRLRADSTGGHLFGTWTPANWSSDVRLKHSIENLNDYYEILFNNLQPKRYKYNNGTSDRYHTGFIAQEVLTAVESAGLTTQDFAAMYLTEREDSGLDEPVWVLRRDEFVALNTWQIQKLKARVTELENEIKEIKQHYEI